SQIKDLQRGFIPLICMLGLICGLIVVEPDLGSAVLLGTVGMILLFLAGGRWGHNFGMVGLCLVSLFYFLFHLAFRLRRLLVFLDPWADPQHAGYQITQSMMAFGSGGIWGKGLGASTLKQLYLPDPHTDFIFPIIGEELGFVGAIAVIALFVYWGWRGW